MGLFYLQLRENSHILSVSCKTTTPLLPPWALRPHGADVRGCLHGVTASSQPWVHLQLGVSVQRLVSGGKGGGDADAGNVRAELRGWGTPRTWTGPVLSSGTSQSDPSCFSAEAAPGRWHPPFSQAALWQDTAPTSLVTTG